MLEGFGDKRIKEGKLSFEPMLPQNWQGYWFNLVYQDIILSFAVNATEVVVTNWSEGSLEIKVYGEVYKVEGGKTLVVKRWGHSIGQQAVAPLQSVDKVNIGNLSSRLDTAIEDQAEGSVNEAISFVQQLVAQIPWDYNIFIFTKSGNFNEAIFYVKKTIDNSWSGDILDLQIKSNLYERQGRAINIMILPASKSKYKVLSTKYKVQWWRCQSS